MKVIGTPSLLSGNNHSVFIRADSSKLVIFFSAINMKENKFNFWQIGRELDANVIFLNDISNQWYLNGISSLAKGFNDTINKLKSWIHYLNVTEVYTIGTSMGGHAAINYGIELDAHILSFPAEIVLNEAHSRSVRHLEKRVNKNFLIDKIAAFNKKIHMVIGESTAIDLIQAGYVRNLGNVEVISLLGVNHYVPSYISRASILYKLLNQFISENSVSKDIFPSLGGFDTYSDEIFSHLKKANHYYHVAEFDKAIRIAKRIIAKFPMFESALYITADSYLKKEEYNLSLNYFARAITIAPNNADYQFKYAHAVRKLGDKTTCLFLLESIIQRFPNYAKAYYVKGILLKEKGMEIKAMNAFKMAFVLDKNNKSFQKQYINLYEKLERKTGF